MRSHKSEYLSAGISKKDLCKGRDRYWYKPHHIATEPQFIANPCGFREDDGVLVSLVMNAERGTSYVVVLDARTMKQLSKANLPDYVPTTLHGGIF